MNRKRKKKNIIFYIAKLTSGGAERVVSNLSLNMPKNINTTIVLFDSKEGNVSYDYKGDLIDLQPPYHLKNLVKSKINYIYSVYKLSKIKKEQKIDATISFIDGSNLKNIYSEIISNYNTKVIISVRNYPSKREKKIRKGLTKLFYNQADYIITLSKGVKLDLLENFGIDRNKIKVIYNPCDSKRINRLSEKKITKRKHKMIFNTPGPVIINVASFKDTGQKGQWHLLRAFKKILENVPDSKLVLMGEGNLEKYLKVLTKDLNLSENVFFIGFQDNPFKFLARSDLFVFPSLFEGFGNVITEAMACGLPIISSDCPSGPREILAPDTDFRKKLRGKIEYAEYGILTPVCDGNYYSANDPLTKEEKMIANAVIRLLKDKEIREHYQNQSKKRIADFKPEKIIEQWLDVIYDN